jgi:hypothetical protein
VDTITALISTAAPFVILIAITVVATVSMMRSNRKQGAPSAGVSGAFGVMDELFNPAADRARNEREAQNERVVPLPSAGAPDAKDGEITIHLKQQKPPRWFNI